MRRVQKRKTGIGIIAFVILMLFGTVAYGRIGLQDKYKEDKLKIERLQSRIDEQEERAVDINNLKAYVQTKKYIEDIAREKLGLVYEDEIIFEPEDEN
jgi:cell division protein DivIC